MIERKLIDNALYWYSIRIDDSVVLWHYDGGWRKAGVDDVCCVVATVVETMS